MEMWILIRGDDLVSVVIKPAGLTTRHVQAGARWRCPVPAAVCPEFCFC